MGKRKKDRIYEGFKCVDCGVNTHDADEYYMVHDELWAAAGMEPAGGMLCVGCLEQRLGRRLTAADFTDAPVNHGSFFYSPRLIERLSTEAAS